MVLGMFLPANAFHKKENSMNIPRKVPSWNALAVELRLSRAM